MCKKLLLLVMMLLGFGASAQELQVFSISGTAELEKDEQWGSLVKGQSLADDDHVRTSKNGSLTILDNRNRKIYAVQSEKGGTVGNLIGSQRHKAKSMTKEAFAEVTKSMFGQQDNRYATRGGVTYRGGNTDELLATWLHANINSRFSISHSQYNVALHTMDPVHQKAVRSVQVGENVELLMVNESDEALYVGLIDIDAEGVWSVVSPNCELLPPHSAVMLPYPIEFFEPRGTDHLLLVAHPEIFNLQRAIELYHSGYRDGGEGQFGAAVLAIDIK